MAEKQLHSVLSCEELTVTYPLKGENALQSVNIQLKAGEIVILAGGNGSGKSTLLHCLAGLIPGIHRAIIKGGYRSDSQPGMALQDSDVFLLPTPAEELDFILQNRGLLPDERRQRLEQLISKFHLESLLKRSMHTLSGGERQRLALAAAMAVAPRLLLLDEPLAQLDTTFAAEFLQLLQETAAGGTAILIATASTNQYETLEAKYVWMHKGEIAWQGGKAEFCEKWEQARQAGIDVDGKGLFSWKNSGKENPQKENVNWDVPILSLEKLSYSYGDNLILNEVDLSVSPGEFAALCGPNGSGKSTLLKLAAGILKPQEGVVRVRGENIAGLSIAEATADSGFLFQNPDHQIFQDKVFKEVAWGLNLRKFEAGLIQARTEKWLKKLKLEHLAQEHPYSLTKTDRQWIALAGVLAREPSLLLLDEPTHGMDCVSTAHFMEVIMELASIGTAVLMVTHHHLLAEHYAHSIFTLEKGRCCQFR